jgi:CRP-like cAMP-binding protein
MSTTPTGNWILDALPMQETDRFLSLSERVPLRPKDLLHRAGQRIERVYFPVSGVVSLMSPTTEDGWVETATVGWEGMVGMAVFLGGNAVGNGQACAQLAGEAITMSSDRFRAFVDSGGKLREVLLAYAQALLAQISQSVACNGVHPLLLRCARRLLETHDRVLGDEFELTQESLADILGVHRPTVTVAARTLQEAGLIRYTRGRIAVIDRSGLEAVACECYRLSQEEYRRVVPVEVPRGPSS